MRVHRDVTVLWWTHKIKGLHRNDFIMAAKIDRLALDRVTKLRTIVDLLETSPVLFHR